MKLTKRIIALSLALVLVLALAACNGNGDKQQEISDAPVSIAIASHVSWPYEDDWKVWQYFKEASGFNLDISAYPGSDFATKTNLMFAAPDTLPDLMHSDWKPAADMYARDGGLRAFDDYAEVMPNYTSYINSLSEDDYAFYMNSRKFADGKIYLAPSFGNIGSGNYKAWLYRKDIFDKHGLETPKTLDELYTVCKKLKELYPNSYPLCARDILTRIGDIGPTWAPYFKPDVYYNKAEDKWHYGATEDTMLEIIEFFKKFHEEGLVPPDFLTMSTNSWQELVTTDRGFIMPDFQVRIDFFNPLGKQINPDFNLTAMVPPYAENGKGQALIAKQGPSHVGLLLCNTMQEDRITNAAKLVDWMYTDEAYDLLSWGKEGETYEVVDGKKVFILDEAGNSPKTLYGFHSYGAYLRLDPEAAEALCSDDLRNTTPMLDEHTDDSIDPRDYLAFTDEEEKERTDVSTAIGTYQKEMINKFMLGQEPLSKWEEYKAELDAMGVDRLLEIYETAYNRMK